MSGNCMMQISICSEESINNAQQALEKGGVWLKVELDGFDHLSYLAPDYLIAWIEGKPVKTFAQFDKLTGEVLEKACTMFDNELHKLFKPDGA